METDGPYRVATLAESGLGGDPAAAAAAAARMYLSDVCAIVNHVL